MEIKLEFVEKKEDEVLHLKVKNLDPDIARLINSFKNVGQYIIGSKDEEIRRVAIEDIYYFEAVEKKVFMCLENEVYEVKDKLYQLEEKYGSGDFVRVSKSVIINVSKIERIYPMISGRFEAELYNQERISISRNYVSDLKRKLGLEDGR